MAETPAVGRADGTGAWTGATDLVPLFSDTVDFTKVMRGLYSVAGGDIHFQFENGSEFVKTIPALTIVPWAVKRIFVTGGTTVTDIIGGT